MTAEEKENFGVKEVCQIMNYISDGYMLVYSKQNALNCTLKLCEFHCTNYFIIYLTKKKPREY